jgi:hypothetical protein
MPASMVGGYRYLRAEVPAGFLPIRIVDSGVFDPGLQQGPVAVFRSKLEDGLELHGIRRAKQHGLRVLLDVEDNHLAGRDVRPEVIAAEAPPSPLQLLFPQAPTRWQRDTILSRLEQLHREAVELADVLVTATQATAGAYEYVGIPTLVIPNAVDLDQWPYVERSGAGTFRIGMAVSPSHGDDLPLVLPALRWAAAQPGVEVVVVGVDPRKPTWTQYRAYQELLAARGQMEPSRFAREAFAWVEQDRQRREAWGFSFRHVGISTYDDYRHQLARLDVGLAPLVENEWSRCRSDSKLIEYASAGVLPIASDAQPFRGWDGRPLPLARDAAGFLELVQWCVEHRDQLPRLAAEARANVRTIQGTVESWRDALAG